MNYSSRLLFAKILISVGLCLYAILPLTVDFGVSHIASHQWSPHARFHLIWVLLANFMALPIFMFAIWSKLHGSGRSVRLAAFIGLAFVMAFFVAKAVSGRFGAALHDAGQGHLIMGLDGNLLSMAFIAILLLSGIVLSIRTKSR